MIAIRRAEARDAALLTELARRTFHDTYVATASADQLAIHLARAFGVEQQSSELADPGLVTLLAEMEGHVAGFAQVRTAAAHAAPPCVRGGRAIEIARFYLEQRWFGRGVAKPLMEAALATGGSAGGEVAWLSVWEGNQRAIRFYEKCGFREVGRAPFRFGDRIEQDWVMSRAIVAGSAVQSGSE